MAKLRPRARIVRTIGDQLISGPEAALIELVKNAYDADATTVLIRIVPKEASPTGDGQIVVLDDGHGMTQADLLEKWLEPATDNKLVEGKSPRSRSLLGAKGIGRFAVSRLGNQLRLDSVAFDKNTSKNERSELQVNWDEFESAKYLDEVDIEIRCNKIEPQIPSGVELTISGLRDPWTKKQLEQLVRELKRLLSPVSKENASFKVFLDLQSFTEESNGFIGQDLVSGWSVPGHESDDEGDLREVRPFKIQDIYHYRIEGTFDAHGSFQGQFTNGRAKSAPISLSIPGPSLELEEQGCGPLGVQLNLYDREYGAVQALFEEAGAKGIGKMVARSILDENIGIGIYRNGFRIRPYGDADSDWLELESKRVQNPSLRLGINQVWGLVEVSKENVSGLIERSSREGFEHNGSFVRLRRLLEGLLSYVEVLRRDYREKAGLSRKAVGTTADVQDSAKFKATEKAVSDLPPQFRKEVEEALTKDREALKTSIADIETYHQSLNSRSTLGLVVSQVLHDGRRFLADISTRSETLVKGGSRLFEQSKFGEHYRATFVKNAELIHASAGDLGKLFKALDPISGRRRGKPKEFDPVVVVNRCLHLFDDAIAEANIQLTIENEDLGAAVFGYESDLVSAVLNIVDNGVYWLKAGTSQPKSLAIKFSRTTKYVRLSISNNGPRINDMFVEKLFAPGFTLKSEGSGIGLAIAREALRSSKWDLDFDREAEDTCFVIEMTRQAGGDSK